MVLVYWRVEKSHLLHYLCICMEWIRNRGHLAGFGDNQKMRRWYRFSISTGMDYFKVYLRATVWIWGWVEGSCDFLTPGVLQTWKFESPCSRSNMLAVIYMMTYILQQDSLRRYLLKLNVLAVHQEELMRWETFGGMNRQPRIVGLYRRLIIIRNGLHLIYIWLYKKQIYVKILG